MTQHAIFIDGQAGTTGLQIRERLAHFPEIQLLEIEPAERKNPAAKRAILARAHVAILCLHDDAARETVQIVNEIKAEGGTAPALIDASTAHRTASGWTYGFAELAQGQAAEIARSRQVSNPGCYATGAIALLRPLTAAGVIGADSALNIHAISGYSGGGRTMIEAYEAAQASPHEAYALGLGHKHLPEIMKYGQINKTPIFTPAVGNFAQGMLVHIPLHLELLQKSLRGADLLDIFDDYYRQTNTTKKWVRVVKDYLDENGQPKTKIAAETLAGHDGLEIFVFANENQRQAVVTARLDNLGKGAAGAAVQNLRLMLGLDNAAQGVF